MSQSRIVRSPDPAPEPLAVVGRAKVAVAVIIPCFNEEMAIASVVSAFRDALPDAHIYVYDNASTDATVARARRAGAHVGHEARRGKGNVMRKMFADVEADVYVMVDGDGTYDPAAAPTMVERLVNERLDMVVGARRPDAQDQGVVYRKGHTTGNAAFTRALRALIGGEFGDVFSGYRVMSRRFVKSMPVHSSGFEIETELSAHAVEIAASCAEVATRYGSRQDGSASKLNTYRDGLRIARTIIRLFEAVRPLQFFALCFMALTATALALAVPVVDQFARTGLVPRFPTAILAASIEIVALLCLACGIILRSVQRTRQEARRLVYLSIGPPGGDPSGWAKPGWSRPR